MIKIGMLGDIGSGKSIIARKFGYPVFNADQEVSKIYKKNKSCFLKLNKKLPKYIKSYPIKKKELINAIIDNKKNLKTIIKIVHPLIRKKMKIFIKKNINRKMIIFDIPLLIENKLNDKNFVLIFVSAKQSKIEKKLRKRKHYNIKIIDSFKKIQRPLEIKKKKSNYIIKNNFKNNYVKKNVKILKKKILLNA